MPHLRIAPALALALVGVGLGLLTGCGGAEPATYNDADVTFASEMTTHHTQAIEMVDLAGDRRVDAALGALGDTIRAAQEPEIDEMTGWLEDWGKPTPGEAASAASAAGAVNMSMGGSMSGMMSAEEMDQLAAAPDSSFEQQWLALMIRHHQGALVMARTEITDGQDPDALAMAQHIADTQADEIDQMRSLLAR